MPQLIAWGNNVAGALDPETQESFITEPRRVWETRNVKDVLWTSWTSTIIRESKTNGMHIWGTSSLVGEERGPATLDPHIEGSESNLKIIGDDVPVAYFTNNVVVHPFGSPVGDKEGLKWEDIVYTGLGSVYAVTAAGEIMRFKSFADFKHNTDSIPISHPALDVRYPISLFSTESRVLALSKGPLVHLFELKEDQHGQVSVHLIEDLEGLGVREVVGGSANRFGVMTEAGDAYLIPKGTIEPELIELEDEAPVRLIGVGSKFEVVVTEDSVWVRGENKFSQLGIEGKETREAFVKHPYFAEDMVKRIISVHCARWSTIICVHDP